MDAARLELVVAASEDDVIGRAHRLPWHLPGDLRHFKTLTTGRAVLMGRKTYDSIGKALPNRTNIVLSRSASFHPGDCLVVSSLEQARFAAADLQLMVIGGAEIYELCMPAASRIHLTLVHAQISDGDTFFDGWRRKEWLEVGRERHESDEKNSFAYTFVTLDRR